MVTIQAPELVSRIRADRAVGADRVARAVRGESGAGAESAVAAAPEQGDLFDPNCPTRLVLDRIGDKWTVLVVLLLSDGPMRFSELRAQLGAVAPKVLTQTLRRIERDGLVTRRVFAEVPPRVEYALTELGRSLTGPIAQIADWAETHLAEISAAQRAFDDQAAAAAGPTGL